MHLAKWLAITSGLSLASSGLACGSGEADDASTTMSMAASTSGSAGAAGDGGTGGAGTSGGGGGARVCEPGSTSACYSGPAGTEDVGTCKPGARICNAEGTGYGPCVGEVLPTADDVCSNAIDDDCDGSINDGCPCTPGEAEACYSGPAGTENTGQCQVGTHSCNPDGAGFGPCIGEVLPAVEVCHNTVDEDCNGVACAAPLWVKLWGPTGTQMPFAVATDGNGNVYVAGSFDASLDLGGGTTLTSQGDIDAFVVKLSPAGNVVWAKSFGGLGNQEALDIATYNNHLAIVGRFQTGITLGPISYTAGAGQSKAFVAKLLQSDGNVLWSSEISIEPTLTHATAVAFDNVGDVIVGGEHKDVGVLEHSAFVRKHAGGGGSLVWTKSFGDASHQAALDVAVDSTGSILVAGRFRGNIAAGTCPQVAAGANYNGFVLKLEPDGDCVFAKSYGDANASQSVNGIAVAPNDQILFTGSFEGTLDCGGGVMTSSGGADVFICKLNANGSYVWSKSFGTAEDSEMGTRVAADGSNVLLLGHYSGAMSVGAITLPPGAGGWDPFLAKLDGSGNTVWAKGFTSSVPAGEVFLGLAIHQSNVLVSGAAIAVTDFGTGPLQADGYDALVAKYAP